MPPLIEALWWIGVLAAVVLTGAIVKRALLVLASLRAIVELAERTLDAAREVRRHLQPAEAVAAESSAAARLPDAARQVTTATASIERRIVRFTQG